MAEKDASVRLRRAVKENNLFLVKRLIQRTDMRNPDTAPRRFTSLAWAATLGHEETFEFLLSAGHDDNELTRDFENNTILMLLADSKPAPANPYSSQPSAQDASGAILRMARLYYDRYSGILDWSNAQGKTALHLASLKGNEELVRMLCDLGADYDLADNKGNTPLHYASAWGHIPVVQLLIERGCQYTARNNEGFTASDYAYSYSTRDTLLDSARLQSENQKKSRRLVFAQAAERGNEWRGSPPISVPSKVQDSMPRLRSGSGTSRTTATSDSGDIDSHALNPGNPAQSSFSSSSSPSQFSTVSNSVYLHPTSSGHTPVPSTSSTATFPGPSFVSSSTALAASINPASVLSPIANRVREQDADAMEKYLRRNRSGSQGTSSTDNRSQNGSNLSSVGAVPNGDDMTSLNSISINSSMTPRRLRPSVSAAQLRSPHDGLFATHPLHPHPESRTRAGTNPASQTTQSPISLLSRSSSTSTSPRSQNPDRKIAGQIENYTGPPSQYAQFPEPPQEDGLAPIAGRRKAFHILSKPLSNVEQLSSSSHRRGMSVTSVRGT